MLFIPFHNLSKLANYLGSVHPNASTAFANAVVAAGDKLKAIGFNNNTTDTHDQSSKDNNEARDGILRDLFVVQGLGNVNIPLSVICPSKFTSSQISQLSSTDVIDIFKGDNKKFQTKKDNLMGFDSFEKLGNDVVFKYGGKSGFTLRVKNTLEARNQINYHLLCDDRGKQEPLVVENNSEEGNLITLMLDIANTKLAWSDKQPVV